MMGTTIAEELQLLGEQHRRIIDSLLGASELLDVEYEECSDALSRLQDSNIYSVNIGFIHSISEHIRSISKIIQVTKANNHGKSYLVSLISPPPKPSQQPLPNTHDFLELNRHNSEVVIHKKQIKGSFMAEVSRHCPNIYSIKLESDQDHNEAGIEDADLHMLTSFKHLSVLNLQDSSVTDSGIELICRKLKTVKELNLSGCFMLTDHSLNLLSQRAKLVTLTLKNMNGISPQSIMLLVSCAYDLNFLNLQRNPAFSDEMLVDIYNVYSTRRSVLKWLEVTSDFGIDLFVNQLCYLTSSKPGQQITDDELSTLLGERPPKYTGIFLGNCEELTKNAVDILLKKCQGCNIKRLCLQHFVGLNDGLVQDLTLSMPNLEYLNLGHCYNITDNSVYYISHNLSIRHLILQHCLSITDHSLITLFEQTGSASKSNRNGLKTLNLAYCSKVTDTSMVELADKARCLEELNLSHCDQITNYAIDLVSLNLRELKRINLNYCEGLTDSSISMLATRLVNNLETLEIQWCQVSQKCIRYIAENLTKLKVLNLSYCPSVFSEEVTLIAKNMPGLQELRLQSCERIESTSLVSIGLYLTNLRTVCLKECAQLDEVGVKTLITNNKGLEFLDFSWCTNLTNIALFDIAKNCFYLKHLNINGCMNIDDEGIQWLCTSVAPLQYLNLTLCSNLTDESILAITGSMRELMYLYISELTEITDVSVSSISQLNKLQELQLRGCLGVTISSLISLLYNLQRLTELNISECRSIEGQSLNRICQFMENIKILEISQIQVEDSFLEELAMYCPKITQLNLCYCNLITDEGVLRMVEKLPRLIKLSLQNTSVSDRTMRLLASALNHRRMQKVVIE